MASQELSRQDPAELLYICDRLKKMGYAESKHIRIYGEEIEMVSNPFPDGDGISVRAISRRETRVKVVKLPLPVWQAAKGKSVA